MAIYDDIRADSTAARRNQDGTKLRALTTLIGEIQTKEKSFSPARSVTDSDVIAIVRRFSENASEMLRMLEASGRDGSAARDEIAIYAKYLPTLMSDGDIEEFARAQKGQGSNMGQIMAALKAEFPGRYDGKKASDIIRRVLAD
jgi:uncharacterized protein YqeY